VPTEWTGPGGGDPDEDGSGERPYGPRPYGPRPYGPRPYGPRANWPPPQPTPDGPRPYGPRPYGPRPYGPRPYGPRPYGPRDEAGGSIDPDEWGADIAEIFCMDSAVIRLGARVVTDAGDLAVLSTEPLEGTPGYVARSAETLSSDPEPRKIELREEKERAALAKRVLKPHDHELAVKVVVPDELVRCLADSPEIAWALKQDIAHGLAVAADQAFLQGDLVGLAPVGITRTPAVTRYPNSGDVLQIARGMVGQIRRRDQVRFGNAGWVLHPFWLDALTRLLTDDFQQQGPGTAMDARGSDRLLSSDGRDGGLLLGFPFVVTAAAVGGRDDLGEDENPRAWIHFSADWSEAWVGAEPGLVAVDVSFESHFQSDETVVRAVVQHDFLLRRPKFFIYRDMEASPMVFEEPGSGANLEQVVLPAADAHAEDAQEEDKT
jgi:hypothetical protein